MAIQVKDAKTITLGGKDVKKITKTDGTILWQSAIDPTSSEYWGTGAKAGEWSDEFCDAIQNLTNAQLAALVGQERKVMVNGVSHTVRVIGYNHDDLADGTGKAALTFEFANLISDSSGNKMTTQYDTSNNYDYTNSILRANLTGEGTASKKTWTNTLLELLPTNLQSNLKTVQKSVATTSSYTVTTYNDKLFPLTWTEIAQSGGSSAKVEGTPYTWWTDNNTTAARIKKDINGTAYDYWLRSPRVSKSSHAWNVDSTGVVDSYRVSGSYAAAPCFCI